MPKKKYVFAPCHEIMTGRFVECPTCGGEAYETTWNSKEEPKVAVRCKDCNPGSLAQAQEIYKSLKS